MRGATGTAKTKILSKLEELGCPVLNLEILAIIKDHCLGKILMLPTTQKYFESLIYQRIAQFNKKQSIIIESESSKIGNLYLPSKMIRKIETSPCIDLLADEKARADFW